MIPPPTLQPQSFATKGMLPQGFCMSVLSLEKFFCSNVTLEHPVPSPSCSIFLFSFLFLHLIAVNMYVCVRMDLPKLKEKPHDGRDFVHFVLHRALEERKEGKEEREAREK